MGTFHDHSSLPEAAAKLAATFEAYYNQKKRILTKRRKDIEVLKRRAGFTSSLVPDTTRKYLEGNQ